MTDTLLRAAWVAPMDAPVVANGAVLVRGEKILAVGTAAKLNRASAGAAVRDFGDAVILPGLINAHTHLELSHLPPPRPAPRRFIDWVMAVMGSAGDAGVAAASAFAGAAESLRYGVTTVGDVSRHCAAVRDVLRASPLRTVSYGEVVGMAKRRDQLAPRLAAAAAELPVDLHVMPGVSPHAPYSVDVDGYRQCLAASRRLSMPLTTHLAETPDEAAFLADHAGPFRELWERLGAWDGDAVPRFAGGPVRYAEHLRLLGHPDTALAHVNYCDDEELAILARGSATVVYCPRTHAYFGHPPHRWRDMLAAGVRVAVGTDSRASSPDLNLVEDLRLLRRLAPDVPAQTVWELATTHAAFAVDAQGFAGSLSPGMRADLAVFPAAGPDPLTNVLDAPATLPIEVWVDGRRVPLPRL